jgi:hypothetical protein
MTIRGFLAERVDKAEHGGGRGSNGGARRMRVNRGGASCDGNGVVGSSIVGGEEAYFWENIGDREGGFTGEGRLSSRLVGIVDNSDG